MINESIRFLKGVLSVDGVPLPGIAADIGTPTYVYSLARVRANFKRLKAAFPGAHLHYSMKANANLQILRALNAEGAGIDAVSGGEIHRALRAGVPARDIVFAGVGKTPEELRYAVEQGVGWVNIENVQECHFLNQIATQAGVSVRVALRYNPDVKANTHPNIATGHKAAKFGLNRDALLQLLHSQGEFNALRFEGLHVHVGSQLGDTTATESGVRAALDILPAFPEIHTLNIGGGFPVQYDDNEQPGFDAFARVVSPLLSDYNVIIEPGRSIVADAGVLLCRVLYAKHQGGQTLYIVDASMTELMRPALYDAKHEIVCVEQTDAPPQNITVVGPVCETTDVLREDARLPSLPYHSLLAILDAGAYGMVMANTYNQRPRPAEVIVREDGTWGVARQRETYEDLLQHEMDDVPHHQGQ